MKERNQKIETICVGVTHSLVNVSCTSVRGGGKAIQNLYINTNLIIKFFSLFCSFAVHSIPQYLHQSARSSILTSSTKITHPVKAVTSRFSCIILWISIKAKKRINDDYEVDTTQGVIGIVIHIHLHIHLTLSKFLPNNLSQLDFSY